VFVGPGGLWRVPASGGTPTALTSLASGERWHTMPHILPGGKAVVFTVLSDTATMDDAIIVAVATDSGERTQLVKGGASARYSPTGHLVYVRNSDLVAVPFDPNGLRVTGTPFLAVPAIRVTPLFLIGQFDVAADGTLAYFPGGGGELQRTLVWIDRKGDVRPTPAPLRPYMHPRLLPDEQGVIIEIEDTPHNIWHYDLVTWRPVAAHARQRQSPCGVESRWSRHGVQLGPDRAAQSLSPGHRRERCT
jgi:eukaryotic-like serine/threonine-protein kinase